MGHLLFRPRFEGRHPHAAAKRCPEVLASWLARYPTSQAADVDFEDWTENAVYLKVCDDLGLDPVILDVRHETGFLTTTGWSTAQSIKGAPRAYMMTAWQQLDAMRGLGQDYELVGSNRDTVGTVGEYASDPIFRKYAGRRVTVSNAEIDNLEKALREAAGDDARVFVKTVQKESAAVYDVDPGKGSYWSQVCRQDEGLEWLPVTHEGTSNPILSMQEAMEPTCEYRMFVVGDRPVTGAGCVEAFTPLDNLDLFDDQMEHLRNRSAVERHPDIVGRYLETATAFAREFADAHGPDLVYSLDLCIDGRTGDVCVIELNPALGLGLYASEPKAFIGAICEMMDD